MVESVSKKAPEGNLFPALFFDNDVSPKLLPVLLYPVISKIFDDCRPHLVLR